MKRLFAVALCLVLALGLLSACRSDDNGDMAQGVTATEVVIGSSFVTSGVFAFVGRPLVDAAEAVIARANAHGGVGGRQIRMIHYCDANDPVTGRLMIERLIEEHQVFALVNINGVNAPMSFEYMRQSGVPTFGITGGISFMYEEYAPGSNIFHFTPSNEICGPLLLARAITESVFGPNRDQRLADDAMIGVMIGNNDAGHDSLRGIMELAEELGIADRIIAEIVTPDTYFPVIQQMMAANAGVLLLGLLDSMGVSAAMNDAGWLVPIFAAYGTSTIPSWSPHTYDPLRPVFANAWATPTMEFAPDMLADFNNALTYHPTLDEATRLSYADNNFAVVGYVTALVFIQGLERLADSGREWTWENFIWAMEQAPFFIQGFGPIDYTNGRRVGITEMALFEYVATPGPGGTWIEEQFIRHDFESLDEVLRRGGWR